MDAKVLHIGRINPDTFNIDEDEILMPYCLANNPLLEKYPQLLDLDFKEVFPNEQQKDDVWNFVLSYCDEKGRELKKDIEEKHHVSYPEHIVNFVWGSPIFSLAIEITYRYFSIKERLKSLKGSGFIVETVNAEFPGKWRDAIQGWNGQTRSFDYQEWLTSMILEYINDPRIKIIRSRMWNLPLKDASSTSFLECLLGRLKSDGVWKKPWRVFCWVLDEAWNRLPSKYVLFGHKIVGVDTITSMLFSFVLLIKGLVKRLDKFVVPPDPLSQEVLQGSIFSEARPLIDKIFKIVFDYQKIVDDFHPQIQANIKKLPRRTSDIFGRSSLGYGDYAFYQAASMLMGHRLCFVQHGADYAVQRRSLGLSVSEKKGYGFIYAGHSIRPDCQSRQITMPSPFFSRKEYKRRFVYNDLVFLTIYPLSCSVAFPPECFGKLSKNEIRFMNGLSQEIVPHLIFRDRPLASECCFYFDRVEFIKQQVKRLRVLDGDNVTKRILSSKLIVLSYSSTLLYEAMAANAPAIMYDEVYIEYCGILPEAASFYNRLKEAGIMHDDYKSALKKVHEVWLDVESWWQSKEIQELRDEFCYRYAWSSKTWRRDWLKFLWNL